MSTSRRCWQQAEARAASLFGARRVPGSGSSGRDDVLTCSDSTHDTLFVEAKLRARSAIRTLHDQTKRRAAKERKTPILAIFDKNRPSFLICTLADDFPTVVAEYIAALDPEEHARLDALLRQAQDRAGARPEAS
jgi:hypothetical protein